MWITYYMDDRREIFIETDAMGIKWVRACEKVSFMPWNLTWNSFFLSNFGLSSQLLPMAKPNLKHTWPHNIDSTFCLSNLTTVQVPLEYVVINRMEIGVLISVF